MVSGLISCSNQNAAPGIKYSFTQVPTMRYMQCWCHGSNDGNIWEADDSCNIWQSVALVSVQCALHCDCCMLPSSSKPIDSLKFFIKPLKVFPLGSFLVGKSRGLYSVCPNLPQMIWIL